MIFVWALIYIRMYLLYFSADTMSTTKRIHNRCCQFRHIRLNTESTSVVVLMCLPRTNLPCIKCIETRRRMPFVILTDHQIKPNKRSQKEQTIGLHNHYGNVQQDYVALFGYHYFGWLANILKELLFHCRPCRRTTEEQQPIALWL